MNNQHLQDVTQVLTWLLSFILLRAVTIWASEKLAGNVALDTKQDVRKKLIRHLTNLGPAYLQGQKSGELAATVMEGVDALDPFFGQYLPQAALAACIPLTILFFILPVDLLSGLVLLVTIPLLPLFMWLVSRVAEKATQRQWKTLSRISAYFLDVIQGLKTLKILGQARRQVDQIEKASRHFREATLAVLRITFLSALVLELLSTLGTALVAVEIGLRLLRGNLQFQQGLFILILAPEFYLPFRLLGLRFHAGMAGLTSAKRIFEILDTPTSHVVAGNRVLTHQEKTINHGTIRFEKIGYYYPGRAEPALQDISLELPVNKITALVGKSGAGKSTLAGLLLRFIEPSQGSITISGKDIAGYPEEVWRTHLAWVPQVPTLFHGTIGKNLLLAKPSASLEELRTAIQRADLLDFLEILPQGFETQVGEGGTLLSAGQLQRLALARAFLKDAPLLILDEPTSNVDALQEQKLVECMLELMEGRTTLLIAHRLNTIRSAHQIAYLEAGRLVEMGKFEDLVKPGGEFYKLLRQGVMA